MDLYLLRIRGADNRFWNKYITYRYEFVINNQNIYFHNYINSQITGNLMIQALKSGGDVVKDESYFESLKRPEKMPEFFNVDHLFGIKNDIIDMHVFSSIKGIKFLDVKVDGNFSQGYKLLTFDKIADCVNWSFSVRSDFSFLSALILDKAKIPQDVDGFFLSGWNKYGKYETIVNENLKNSLTSLTSGKDFLVFNKLQVE